MKKSKLETANIILLIDGNALAHRAFHALPDFKTSKGVHTNALYGFTTMLHRAIEGFRPTHVVVCFDTPKPTFRDQLYDEYRITRPETAEHLKSQFPLIKQMLSAAGIVATEKDGFEADDLIAMIKKEVTPESNRIIIITGDRDLLQLVDDKTIVATPQIGFSKNTLYDPSKVKEWYHIYL